MKYRLTLLMLWTLWSLPALADKDALVGRLVGIVELQSSLEQQRSILQSQISNSNALSKLDAATREKNSEQFVQQFRTAEALEDVKKALSKSLSEEELNQSLRHFDDPISRRAYPEIRRAVRLDAVPLRQALESLNLPEPSLRRVSLLRQLTELSGQAEQTLELRLSHIARSLGVSNPAAEQAASSGLEALRSSLTQSIHRQYMDAMLLALRDLHDSEVETFVSQAIQPSVVKLSLLLSSATMEAVQRRSLPLLLELVRINLQAQDVVLAAPLAAAPKREPVPVVLVPLLDFPEDFAHDLAKLLEQHLGLPIKSTLRLGDLGHMPFKRNPAQASADAIIETAGPIVRRFAEVGPQTMIALLTKQDINSDKVQSNFLFAWHYHPGKVSVISIANLFPNQPILPPQRHPLFDRTYKMVKRAIGEHHLGWRRSNNPLDLMFSPIAQASDLDRLSIDHRPQSIMLQSPRLP